MNEHVGQPDAQTVLAVQQLFIKHANQLRGLINGLFPDFDLADDVLQDVFVIITEKAATYDPSYDFQGWAYGIAKRKALEHGRRYHSNKKTRTLSPETLELLCESAPQPRADDQGNNDSRYLSHCLEKLSPRMREMVQLRYQDDLTPATIAERLQWTSEAVYVALSRARSSLRRCLQIAAHGGAT